MMTITNQYLNYSIMKKSHIIFYLAAVALLCLPSCEKKQEEVKTFDVTVQLSYPDGFAPAADVTVTLKNSISGAVLTNTTSAAGAAAFTVVAGLYEASATDERADEIYRYLINGNNNNISVTDAWVNGTSATIALTATAVPKPAAGDVSPYGKLIIKELYIGGCQKNDGSGAFIQDPYLIVYNNSTQPASIAGLSIGASHPANAHATNNFIQNGELIYANAGWIPSHYGAWQIQNSDTLAPGEQIVIAINGAIDHTQTYHNSVNLANADYVCYDIENWANPNYYPAPSENIPTSHYLKALKLPGASGNAWIFSTLCPAAFIFTPAAGVSLAEYAANPDNRVLHGASASQVNLKVQASWVLDGIEVYAAGRTADSKKRLTPAIDGGYIEFTNNHGHTLYRNVDQAATEAILGNAGKLVYNYSLGFDDSTDPSGIDAEASIKNGAHIIYKETNNTANDFHQRSRASLRPLTQI
jgi:hypothetical protein